MNVDLHCHSDRSDGLLAPAALVARACLHGVDVLALTDHDTVTGLEEARAAAASTALRLVDGVEISVTWRGRTLHVLGLGIDPGNAALRAGLDTVQAGRLERARGMAESLADAGIPDALDGALGHAKNPAMLSRTHFARHLVATGKVSDMRAAFRAYLVPGKPGYVAHRWSTLEAATGWICGAGGQAVLAHPGRYALSAGALEGLLAEFRAVGGSGLEVVSGSHSEGEAASWTAVALHGGWRASRGSDFHAPGEGAELGGVAALDARLDPVWRAFSPAPGH